MNAEIISVGTELLLGQVVNTDAAIVAQALSGLGINLLYSAVVGDNADRLRCAVDCYLPQRSAYYDRGPGAYHRRSDKGDCRGGSREEACPP